MNESGLRTYADKYGILAAFTHRHVIGTVIGYLTNCCNTPVIAGAKETSACSKCLSPCNKYMLNGWLADDPAAWTQYQKKMRFADDTMRDVFSTLGLDCDTLKRE